MSLLNCLREQFGPEWFDASDVWIQATVNTALADALDAEVPHIRYKYGRVGEMNMDAIRRALRRLPGLSLHRPGGQYWRFRCKA